LLVACCYTYIQHHTAEVNNDWSEFAAGASAAWHRWRQYCPNHFRADALAAACILPLKGGEISIYNIISTTTAAAAAAVATVDSSSKHVPVKHEAVAASSNGDVDTSDATPTVQETSATAVKTVKAEAVPTTSKAAAMFMCDGSIVGNILGYVGSKPHAKTEATTGAHTSVSSKGVGSSRGNSAVAAVLRSKVLLRAVPYDTLVHEPLALLRCRQGVLASADVFTAMVSVLQSALTASATVAKAAAHRRRYVLRTISRILECIMRACECCRSTSGYYVYRVLPSTPDRHLRVLAMP
jgi:hypothetical protein